jgi:hypothetical protein
MRLSDTIASLQTPIQKTFIPHPDAESLAYDIRIMMYSPRLFGCVGSGHGWKMVGMEVFYLAF